MASESLAALDAGGAPELTVDPASGALSWDRGSRTTATKLDDDGRLVSLLLADGARVDVDWTADGRVESIRGPGHNRWDFAWTQDGLEARDGAGGRWTVDRHVDVDGEAERIEVIDALGRRARSWWATTDGALLAFEDPTGRRGRFERHATGWHLVDTAGVSWRYDRDSDGATLVDGAGRHWRWTLDGEGRPVGLLDPAGRRTRWTWDVDGHVTEISRAGAVWRFDRNEGGAVVEVSDPSGAVTQVSRGAGGRVLSVSDPEGDTLHADTDAEGRVRAVLSRSGASWAMGYDLVGRLDRLVDPDDRTLLLDRDADGHLRRIRDSAFGTVRLDRDGAGRLTRVVDPEGRGTGLVRDAAGRVEAIRRGDGSVIRVERDLRGDIRALAFGGVQVEVERDPLGRVTAVGDVRWRRGASGSVRGIDTPWRSLLLSRDDAGWLVGLATGGWKASVERDRLARPFRWGGTDSGVEWGRDLAGRPVREQVSNRDVSVRLSRDSSGHTFEVREGADRWRWKRDAAGRALRIEGPAATNMGIDRDHVGRPRLLRYPDGSMVLRRAVGERREEEIRDGGGRLLDTLRSEVDLEGRLARREDDMGTWVVHRDPLNVVSSMESPDGRGWSWMPDGAQGPDGELTLRDERGLLVESRPPLGMPVWGVASEVLVLMRDSTGRLLEARGESGSALPRYDELGRLALMDVDGLGRVEVSYDARGRVERVFGDSGDHTLLWAPEADEGRADLLLRDATGATWIQGPGGPAVRADEHGAISLVMRDSFGVPTWRSEPTLGMFVVPPGPLGAAEGGLDVSARGSVRLGPGGPWLFEGRACDPVVGESLSGAAQLPWGNWPGHEDPAAWAPESPWSAPLALLAALGVIDPLGGTTWSTWERTSPAWSWLPSSVDAGTVPWGPDPAAWPLEEPPLVARIIEAGRAGGEPLSVESFRRVALGVLQPSPWLPPGIELPGLWWTRTPSPADCEVPPLQRSG